MIDSMVVCVRLGRPAAAEFNVTDSLSAQSSRSSVEARLQIVKPRVIHSVQDARMSLSDSCLAPITTSRGVLRSASAG